NRYMFASDMRHNYLLIIFIILLIPVAGWAQDGAIVKGTVRDAATNEVLPGVNIRILDTSRGTVTDGEGHYELRVPVDELRLQFSYIGYESKTKRITGLAADEERSLDIVLTSS